MKPCVLDEYPPIHTSHLEPAEFEVLRPAPDSHTATLPESDGYAAFFALVPPLPGSSENHSSFSYVARCRLSGLFPVLYLPGRQLAGYTSPVVSVHLRCFHQHKTQPVVMAGF